MTRRRRLAAVVRSPGDALLAVRMTALAAVLPVLKAKVPMDRLVPLLWRAGSRDGRRDPDRDMQVVALSRLSHRLVGLGRRDNCLERSLIAYRHLAASNAAPLLVVGARHGAAGVEGHVWVVVDGEAVHDLRADIDTYVAVTSFGARGRRLTPE